MSYLGFYPKGKNMTYENFKITLVDSLKDWFPAGTVFNVRKIIKTNDTILDGLVISEKARNISPTIYLNSYYSDLTSGSYSYDEIVLRVLDEYRENRLSKNFDTDDFTDFSRSKSHIIFRVINTKRNSALLSDVPNIPFLDLSIVFAYLVNGGTSLSCPDSMASILIHNSHINCWGITKEDLLALAKENTPKLLPEYFDTLDTVITSLMGFNPYEGCEERVPMYILTNERKTNGAAVIIYSDLLKNISKKLDSDLYVLPSSIHEVLIVPSKVAITKTILDKMVIDVNTTEVAENEILSDHAYFYSRKENRLSA